MWKLSQSIRDEDFGQIQSCKCVGQWLVMNTLQEDNRVMLHFYRLHHHEFKHKQTIQLDTVTDLRQHIIYPIIYLTYGVCVVINDLMEIYHLKDNVWELADLVNHFVSRRGPPAPHISSDPHINSNAIFINYYTGIHIYEREGDKWTFVFQLIDFMEIRQAFMNFVK
jgi:hypothetical protein